MSSKFFGNKHENQVNKGKKVKQKSFKGAAKRINNLRKSGRGQ